MTDTFPTSEGAFSSHGKKSPLERSTAEDEPAPVVVSVEQAKPSLLVRYGLTVLVAAVVSAAVATGVGVVMNIGVANRGGGDRLKQEGKVRVGPNAAREVFYPEPFAGPPNLELDGPMVFITLKEQKADRFTIQSQVDGQVHWRAEGMRVK